MICGQCKGLMVVETTYDTDLAISGEPQEARCLNCGNIEDTVIYINRLARERLHGHPLVSAKRAPVPS